MFRQIFMSHTNIYGNSTIKRALASRTNNKKKFIKHAHIDDLYVQHYIFDVCIQFNEFLIHFHLFSFILFKWTKRNRRNFVNRINWRFVSRITYMRSHLNVLYISHSFNKISNIHIITQNINTHEREKKQTQMKNMRQIFNIKQTFSQYSNHFLFTWFWFCEFKNKVSLSCCYLFIDHHERMHVQLSGKQDRDD